MPFFGNAIIAPTAFARVVQLVIDLTNYATPTTLQSNGTANAVPGGQFEFDIGNGQTRRVSHSADLTCSSANAGPAIGGRDQAGSFGLGTYVYLYALLFTGDFTTVGYILSASPVAPTIPAGWQSPIFCGGWRTSTITTNQLQQGHRRNGWMYIDNGFLIVNTATAPTAEQTASLSVLPPTTKEYRVSTTGSHAGNTAVNNSAILSLRATSGTLYDQDNMWTQVASQSAPGDMKMELPYVSASLFWAWVFSGTSAGTLATAINITSFRDF
jgi:hypothetical protein